MNREDKIRIACDEYIGHKKDVGEDISISLQRAAFADGANWMEKEIFNQLKEALDYSYLFDSYSLDEHEVDNLQDYLKLIKNERTLEKEMDYDMEEILKSFKTLPKDILLWAIYRLMQDGVIDYHEITKLHIGHLENLRKHEEQSFWELQQRVTSLWCDKKKNIKANIKDIMQYLKDKGRYNITQDEIDKY